MVFPSQAQALGPFPRRRRAEEDQVPGLHLPLNKKSNHRNNDDHRKNHPDI